MPRIECLLLSCCFLISAAGHAAPKTVAPTPDERPSRVQIPQAARDLEGLDPREGAITKGLRGTFTVRHYVSGPWKGGSAILEVASDLSYAEIRIFDVEGNLQRLYSIHPSAKQGGRINAASATDPVAVVRENTPPPSPEAPTEQAVTRSRDREEEVQEQTERAFKEDQQERAEAFAGRRGTVSNRAGSIRETSTYEEVQADERREQERAREKERQRKLTASNSQTVLRKRTVRVKKKRLRKGGSALDTPLSGPRDKYEYYYEDVVVTERVPVEGSGEVAQESAASSGETEVASVPPPTRRAAAEPPPPVAPPPPEPPPPVRAEPPPPPPERSRRGSKNTTASTEVASTRMIPRPSGEELSGPIPTIAKPVGTAAYDESSLPDVSQAVKENEAESKGEPKTGKSEGDKWTPKKSVPPPAPPVEELPPPPPAKKTPPPVENLDDAQKAAMKMESDKWKPTTATPTPAEPVEDLPPLPSKKKQPEPVAEDISAAQKAALKMESDTWKPKGPSATPTDAELGLVPLEGAPGSKVARKPGVVDDMVPMSDAVKRGGQVNQGGEQWSPTASAKLSPQEQQQLAMTNNLKPVSQRPAIVKVNRDVNNPEEGVKPFYSLEKYSGPQYGRHREFERRVIYKQNTKTSVKGYDFYIDEVDRKQEKHYLYYYRVDPKTKKAKLIATEKHEKVTFLSNYDIGSEDKGKIDHE